MDYLHGLAESFLTLTNLFIVAAFRKAVVDEERQGREGNDEGEWGKTAAGNGGKLISSGHCLGKRVCSSFCPTRTLAHVAVERAPTDHRKVGGSGGGQ